LSGSPPVRVAAALAPLASLERNRGHARAFGTTAAAGGLCARALVAAWILLDRRSSAHR
jgi:hypothetical protein